MVGIVFLKTDKFEVKLEGIAFKVNEFESLCSMDFLFPEGKIRHNRPIVGVDILRHPRDPNVLLLLLCVGIGCVILRFEANEMLPEPILNFLTDDRICFVGFKIPEKKDLFPFENLGLRKSKVDVGYLAAKHLNDPNLKKCELSELARKVIGINQMVGLAEAGSYERHEQIKIAVCEVFISSVIAMMLLNPKKKKKITSRGDSPKKSLPVKKLDSKMLKIKKKLKCRNKEGGPAEKETPAGDYLVKHGVLSSPVLSSPPLSSPNKPLKGILKLPSFSNPGGSKENSPQYSSSPPTSKGHSNSQGAYLRRANSKGHNVSFRAQ